MYYNKSKLNRYNVRKNWIKELLDITKQMSNVAEILEKYAFYIDEHNCFYTVECVNEVIAFIVEVAYAFGGLLNCKVHFGEDTIVNACIDAFEEGSKPKDYVVRRMMKGIK